MEQTAVDRAGTAGTPPAPRRPGPVGPSRRFPWWTVPAVAAVTLSACSLHVSSHGVSGNVFGHSFSAAKGSLPSGFPSNVPVPDNSRVLGGGGTQNNWDVAFAVTGSLTAGTAAYQSKFESAGYTISGVRSGTTPVTGGASGTTSTTLALTGSVFTAKNTQWTVEAVSGSSSTIKGSPLKSGEFAIDIAVVPISETTIPSP
jgi:hypothetical protein